MTEMESTMFQTLTVGWPTGQAGDIFNAYNKQDIFNKSITQWLITRGKDKWDIKKGASGIVTDIFLVPLTIKKNKYVDKIGKNSRIKVELSTSIPFITNGPNERIYTIVTTQHPPFTSKGGSPHLMKILRFSSVSPIKVIKLNELSRKLLAMGWGTELGPLSRRHP